MKRPSAERKRICVRCKKRKRLSEFSKSLYKQAYVTGISSICKVCFPKHKEEVLERKRNKRIKLINKKIESAKRDIHKKMLEIKKLKDELDAINKT